MRKFIFVFFIFVTAIYYITSAGTTPFDYFTRLADSFLAGKYYLSESVPWLSELIPSGNKFFVVYPPMPALILIPLRYVFEKYFEQQYLAHLLGAGVVALTMGISWKIKKSKPLLVWTGIFTAFGTIIWFLSSVGSSWYLGQITAAFFITAAIYESLSKKRAFLVGVFLGAAYLSRLHTILSLPFFLYLFFDKKNWFSNYLNIFIGAIPFALFNFTYNFVRFGVIWDKSYILIPGLLSEPWFNKGLFNISYIPSHLKIIFASFPKVINEFPYIIPSWAGLSIWITSPVFIFSLFSNIKEKMNIFSWISIILISFVIFSHGTTGFTQFGYRFAVDFYPFLTLLTIKGAGSGKLKWHHWLLLTLSVIVNLWGVLWINKFGYVAF